ncbi:MAG: MarR family winged helix-turn-helix transcriptional regulator, partial [Deferrisomatales bacterium]
YFKGPLLLGELQRKVLVSSGGTTYLVDRLEQRGYLDRRRSPDDRRAVYAVLTAAGEAFFREIFPQHAQGLVESVSGLSRDEQVEVTRLLRRLGRSAAEQLRPEAGR